jgi:hypothetical protein
MRLVLGFLLLFSLISCDQDQPLESLNLFPTPVTKLKQTYAVVMIPILGVLQGPNEEAPLSTILYRGTIVEVESVAPQREIVKGNVGRWILIRYQGRRGWVFSPSVELFDELYLARRRVQSLRNLSESSQ